jgi:hypothetical protein
VVNPFLTGILKVTSMVPPASLSSEKRFGLHDIFSGPLSEKPEKFFLQGRQKQKSSFNILSAGISVKVRFVVHRKFQPDDIRLQKITYCQIYGY